MTVTHADWPFDSPPNVACVTLQSNRGRCQARAHGDPRCARRGWQFLTGDAFDTAEAMLVSLRSLVERDPTLLELTDVQPGWTAWREHHGAPWIRQPEARQAGPMNRGREAMRAAQAASGMRITPQVRPRAPADHRGSRDR